MIIFKEFPQICRLCTCPGTLQPIMQIKVLDVLRKITNIEVSDDDKLPENVCSTCVKRLEDIAVFIETCKANDEALRTVILNEYEKSFIDAEKAEDSDTEPYDDVKSENEHDSRDSNYFSNGIKEEIITEPDIAGYNKLNEEEKVTCENCSLSFPDAHGLREHYKEILNCQPVDFDETETVPNIVDFLKKGTKKERGLRSKQKKEKPEADEEEPEYLKGRKLKGKRRFLCSYCGKNYTRKNGLDRHILSHTGVKPFECKECGKRYITKDTLKTHLLTHTGVKAHKCPVCQKSFTQSSHLSYHIRRHSGEKPHSCTFCGKGFLSNYHLERHKLMHTGVKPFECKQCGKHFVRGTTLRDHLLIHTGEKPFQCQHCGKQFNRKQSLTNHVLVHTGHTRSSGGGASLVSVVSNLLYTEPRPVDSGF